MNRKTRLGGRGILVAMAALAVVVALPGSPVLAIDDDTCLACHSDPDALSDAGDRAKDLVVTAESLEGSVHEGFSCTDCHQDLASDDAEIPHPPELAPVDCAQCHGDVAEGFHENSIHADAIETGPGARSACSACHGNHHILPVADPGSPASPAHVADLCARCHGDPEGHGPVEQWKASIHGRAVLKWKMAEDAPTCVSCHPAHEIRPAADPDAGTSHAKVMDTCGSCHPSEERAVLRGIHGRRWKEGVEEAPTCVDCHGAHEVDRPDEHTSLVYADHQAATCGRCHADPEFAKKFGVPADRLDTYRHTFHGIASAWGDAQVAACSSCHGYHDIRPEDDPASTIHPENRQATCGQAACHPGATAGFAQLPVHGLAAAPDNAKFILKIVRFAYFLIILGTIGGMLLHQVFELIAIARTKRALAAEGRHVFPELPAVAKPAREPLSRFVRRDGRHWVVRWDMNQVLQHFFLVISFTTLVITGFPLLMPASWFSFLGDLGPAVFELRGLLHRIAAVILIAVSLYHVFWLFFTGRGRRELLEIVPRPMSCLRFVLDTVRWFIGLRKEPPAGGRYTYREKMEYWSLIWGNFVMITTGFILWTAPRWHWLVVDVAQLIHRYEAILAFLAILVWHMVGAHLKPGIFPMNPTWLTGGVDPHFFREEHAREYAEMVAWYGFDPLAEEEEKAH